MSEVTAGAVVLLAVPLLWALMYLGWRGRRSRFAGLPEPAAVPESGVGPVVLPPVPGVYVSTTTAGDWLDRVVAHGLGVRADAQLEVGAAGVLWRRRGASGLFVPASDLVGVHRTRGQAGKFTLEEGLVVVTWRLGEVELDTGFRPRDWADIATVVAGLERLVPGQERPASQPGPSAAEDLRAGEEARAGEDLPPGADLRGGEDGSAGGGREGTA